MQSVAPQIARRINDRVAMDLLLERGQMTRSEMRAATGMSQPSTLELFDRLLAEELIQLAGSVTGRRGPQALTYRVNARRALIAVARVDSRETVAGISDLTGSLVGKTIALTADPARTAAQRVATAIRAVLRAENLDPRGIHSAVVATPGVIDPTSRQVTYIADHPEWASLRSELEGDIGLRVHLENRVKLLGLAELRDSPAPRDENFVLVSIGPAGIAAAVIVDGKLLRGANGAAGEIAYLPVGTEPVVLEPGNRARGGLFDVMTQSDWSQASGPPQNLVEAIGRAIGSVCSVVDPQRIVLAGPWGQLGGTELATALENHLRSSWPLPTRVCPSVVTGDPILKGAAVAGMELAHGDLWGPTTGLTRREQPL